MYMEFKTSFFAIAVLVHDCLLEDKNIVHFVVVETVSFLWLVLLQKHAVVCPAQEYCTVWTMLFCNCCLTVEDILMIY